MEFEDIANLVNRVAIERMGRPLKDVERIVLEGAWYHQTYGAMAKQVGGYTEDYLKKDVGPKLWRLLSELIDQPGVKVTKRNIQNVLRHWATQSLELETPTDAPPLTARQQTTGGAQGESSSPRPSLEVGSSSRLDVSDLVGRQQELSQLHHWLQEEACRSVLIWGLPGVGKTTLATKILEELPPEISTSGYLSLNVAVQDEAFLNALVNWLEPGQDGSLSTNTDPLGWILHQFEQRRCVLVVDHLEALFQPGQPTGTYRSGTAAIQQFVQLVAEQVHQSSVVWVSREKPVEFSQLRGGRCRDYQLQDLVPEEAISLLQAWGLRAEPQTWQTLYDRYGGCPLVLKGVAATVQEVYQGQVAALLETPQPLIPPVFADDIEQVLCRLTTEESDVLYWLALAQTPVALATLTIAMVSPPGATTVQSLLGRGLCHPVLRDDDLGTELTLAPMVRTNILNRLQAVLLQELLEDRLQVLNRLPLVAMTAGEATQERQRQALLYPLRDQLQRHYPAEAELTQKCQQLHQVLRDNYQGQPGYGTGNFIHLCHSLGMSMSGANFAHLSIWQSDLRHVSLQGADCSHASFADTAFATALGRNPVMAFSHDGAYLATGDQEGRLLLWELEQGKLVQVLDHDLIQGVSALAFGPTSDGLAVGTDSGQIWLWALSGSYRPDCLEEHHHAVVALAFSPNGRWLASGDRAGQIYLWDVAAGVVQVPLSHHQGAIRSLDFHPAGQTLLSAGEDQRACVWNLEQQTVVKEFQAAPTAQIRTVGYLADPLWPNRPLRAVAAGYDEHSLTLWDVATGRTHWAVPIEDQAILAIALNRNGQNLVCSYQDFSVVLWNLPQRRVRHHLTTFHAPVWSLGFSPDGQRFATGGDYAVKLWDTASSACLRSFLSQAHPVRCLTFTHDGDRLLTGHEDHSLRLWQLDGANTFTACPNQLVGHSAPILDLAASPDGHWWASSAEDLTIRLWHNATRRCQRVLAPLSTPCDVMAFSPDSGWLAGAGEDTAIVLWEVATGERITLLEGHESPPSALVFSPDGSGLVSGSRDGDLLLWDVAEGRCHTVLRGHQGRIHSLALGPHGKRLASASHDGCVNWWNLSHPELLGQWCHPHGHWLQMVVVTPTAEILAVTSQSALLEVWNITENRCCYRLEGHTQDIWRAVVSPDKTLLATASQDDEIRLWRLDSGTGLQILRPDRPYEGLNILGAAGLTEPEETMLKALGAVIRYND